MIVLTSKGIIFALIALVLIVDANSGDVVVLTKENFDSVVYGNVTVLVDFYALWSGASKNLAPHFERAAAALQDLPVAFGKVDIEAEKELAHRFGIYKVPTILVYKVGHSQSPFDYKGDRTAGGIRAK